MTPRERLADTRLYLVCDARPRAFLDAALRGGADLIQLRDKSLDDDGLIEAAKTFRAAGRIARGRSARRAALTAALSQPVSPSMPAVLWLLPRDRGLR